MSSSISPIRFSGLASGLDTESIVNALMDVERLPLLRLEAQRTEKDEDRSLVLELNTLVTSLKDAALGLLDLNAFSAKAATSADQSVATAVAGNAAAAGTYNVTVTQLAQSHTLQSAAAPALGDGDTLEVTVDGELTSYTYSAADGLQGLADQINAAGDVSASVVSGRLVLISEQAGAAGSITVGGTGAGALGFAETQAAQDALATVNGVQVTGSSNVIADAIGDLDLTLTGIGSTTVSVGTDSEAVLEKVRTFVEAYNELSFEIREATAYDAETRIAGPLQGDQVFTGFVSQLRAAAGDVVDALAGTAYASLADVGITAAKDGTLSLDEAALRTAFAADPAAVETLFADATDGIARTVRNLTGDFSAGPLAGRLSGLSSDIARLDDQVSRLEDRLMDKEESLWRQFSAVESAIAQLQTQQSALLQGLAGLGF